MRNNRTYTFSIVTGILLAWMVFGNAFVAKGQYKSASYEERYYSKKRASANSESSINKKLDQAESVYKEDASKALKLVEDALLKSIKNDYMVGQARSNKILADINYDMKEFRLAFANYTKAYQLYLKLKNKNIQYEILPKMANSAEETGKLASALEYYQLYLSEAKNRKRTDDELNAQNSIARIYEKKGELDKSERQLVQSLSSSMQINNKRAALNSTKQLGKIKEKQNKNYEAINYYNQSKELAYELDDPKEINQSYSNISNVYRNSKDMENTIKTQEEAIEFNKQKGLVNDWAGNQLEMGTTLLDNNDNPRAIEALEQNIALADEAGNLDVKSKTIEALSRAYKKEGLDSKAKQLYQDYLVLSDSIRKMRDEELERKFMRNELLENIQDKMMLLEKDKELDMKKIEILEQEKALGDQEMKVQRWVSYSLGGIILILIATSVMVYMGIRQKRIANQLLMLKSLRSQMNPHFIFNALNSVNNFISMSDERSANKYLSDFSRLMRQVMQNSQEDFIPLSNEIGILSLYMKLEHFRFKNKFEYTFEVDENMNQEEIYIPPMLIQPYIENAVWHGLRYKKDMGYLKVEVKQEGDTINILVEDNGIGRKKSKELKTKNQKTQKSTGMKNVDNRLKILNEVYGARLQVEISDLDPVAESGTQVEIKIPRYRPKEPLK